MSLTNAYENAALNTLFRGQSWTPPSHLALYIGDPTETGASGTEVTGGSYARQPITTPATFWSAAASGQTSNAAVVEFPQATANWGTPTHFALFDAASGGNMIARGTITTPKAFDTGDIARFQAGALVLTAD